MTYQNCSLITTNSMIRIENKKNIYIMFKSCLARLLLSLLIIAEPYNLFFYKTKAENYTLLRSLANECFQYRENKKCSNALNKVEKFQLLAGANDNYKCQTRLIGLQSQFIMVMMKMKRSTFPTESFGEIKEACGDLIYHSTEVIN